MPSRRAHVSPQSSHGQLAAALAALREEHGVPDGFPEPVLAEAAQAAQQAAAGVKTDLHSVPFATLDPAGSRDLDQAFHLERRGDGFRVRYAIADVPAFVRPGGAIDAEARRRGQTLYLPDGSVPLHPPVLSEGRASLLPREDRTAYVWTVDLDGSGAVGSARLERALIRSREQLDYRGAQRLVDARRAEGPLALLPEVGGLRIAQERARGGASLNLPDEEIVQGPDGYSIERRFPLPVEEWNAQLSLLVGMIAGEMMLEARVGILRTMPPPTPDALAEFRAAVAALGTPWPAGRPYGEYLHGLDPALPQTPAVLHAAASLFRGADYTAFDGSLPEQAVQAAIAAPYAHVTAPLRRLVDRWGLIVCEALCEGLPIPEWVRESLAELPGIMEASGQRVSRITSAALDRVEAALLRDRIGETLPAIVIEARGDRTRVQLTDPPVTASLEGSAAAAGSPVRVRVVSAEVASGAIRLALAEEPELRAARV